MKLQPMSRVLSLITALIILHLCTVVVRTVASSSSSISTSSTTGFSLPLIPSSNHKLQGLDDDHTIIHRRSDGFLHLQHKNSPTPSSSSSSSLRLLPHEVHIHLDTNPYRYILKIDRSSPLTWIQCRPCDPQAPQFNPVFDPSTSRTFRNVSGTSIVCRPPNGHPVFNGRLCHFRVTDPRSSSGLDVEGFLAQEQLSINGRTVAPDFYFGCSHSTVNFPSEGRYAGVATISSSAPTSLVTQLATSGAAAPRLFSYCLFASNGTSNNRRRQGFLRFGTDVPTSNNHPRRYRTTRILAAPPLDDEHDDREFHVSLVGISLGARKLDEVRPEMFVRRSSSDDGRRRGGGCVIDLSTPFTTMVREAYDVVEEAVWSELQSHGAERVVDEPLGFNLCFRETEEIKRHLQPLSLHFLPINEEDQEEGAVMVLSPEQLFLMMNDERGGRRKIACLAVTPGHRTVIGAMQQMDTRFVYDLNASTVSFAPESCADDTAEIE